MKRLETPNAQWLHAKSHIIQSILHKEYQRMLSATPRTWGPGSSYEHMRNLEQWVIEHGNAWTYTCGGCVLCNEIYCQRKPLTMREVISAVMKTKRLAEENIIHIPEKFYR